MGWKRHGAALAMAAVGCSSPNPAFDPGRKVDTDPLGTDDDGETTVASDPMGSGDDGDAGSELTGSGTPVICPDGPAPALKVTFGVLHEGERVHRCGMMSGGSGCTLRRDPTAGQWELHNCALHDAWAEGDVYVLDFGNDGPDVNLGARDIEISYSFSSEADECRLQWLKLSSSQPQVDGAPPLLYQAATNLAANDVLEVTAEQGEHLDTLCECGSADAACCPGDAGLHELIISRDGLFFEVVLSQLDPIIVVPVPQSEVSYEAKVVRAWQPPMCDAPPENQWIVKQLLGP